MSADKEEEASLVHLLNRKGETFYMGGKKHGKQKTLPGKVTSSAKVKDMSVCKPSEQEIVARVSGLGK